jgi:hypothetical protein
MAKNSNEKASKPAKNRVRNKESELATPESEVDLTLSNDDAPILPPSKKELRAEAKSEKKAGKSASRKSSSKSEEDSESSDLLASLPKEKRLKSPLLNLAIITFFLAIIISLISVIFPFRDVVSVNSDVIETLSVEVVISASEFLTAPAISACQGSGRLTGLPNANIYLSADDGSWKVNSKLGSGQLNSDGDCVYTPEIQTPESFSGGTVKARVAFSFGSSATYTVDGYSINLDINLDS